MTVLKPSAGRVFQGHAYVHGRASGRLIASNLELSVWGGVSPDTGEIIDRHHPLSGQYLEGAILAIPGGRGSCSGSGVMLELLLNDKGPSALVFERREDILTLGVMIAQEIFGKAIPVVALTPGDFQEFLKLDGSQIHVSGGNVSNSEFSPVAGTDNEPSLATSTIVLSDLDQSFLDGACGEAARIAIRIVIRMAELLGAQELMDITQVHVDGCIYTGPGSLAFAQRLRDMGGKVKVPTSLNSVSVDQQRWAAQGVDSAFAEAARDLATAYTDMGAQPTFTCAPYYLESAPKLGDQVAWAESNAVVYANSVLGARTMKYPDFLDICIALTGRAPMGGPHITENRLASVIVNVEDITGFKGIDDSFYPILGYELGALAGGRIPVVIGMESLQPSKDDLKAFGAAFATVSSAPMFHILGITPEATDLDAIISKGVDPQKIKLNLTELNLCWDKLNGRLGRQPVDLVSLGNPHFSVTEIRKLALLCRDRTKDENVDIMVTCGRATYALATQAGLIGELEKFGVQFITDTCWCMITEPTIPKSKKAIMTNSAKYAHYGPGLTGREFYFGSLSGCVEAACRSENSADRPQWLLSVDA